MTMPIASFSGTVIRVAPDGRKTQFNIDNPQVAKYLFDLQKHGYKYIKVQAVDNICLSCEG